MKPTCATVIAMLTLSGVMAFSLMATAGDEPKPAKPEGAPLAKLPAFPGAEGYGSLTPGGRGGKVIAVTNLKGSGPGSLREACQAKGPRIVVFQVSGTIDGDVNITNDNITIAGQTAPGDGITLKGRLSINANDVVIRYIRVRAKGTGDAVSARGRKNIILDHVSASWSADEVLSIYHGENVTIQWCMITEACSKDHKFGAIWGNNRGTYHHNLFAHNASRNPRWASGCGDNDYRNNVVYNWGHQSSYGAEAQQKGRPELNFANINMVANYYKPGPGTQPEVKGRIADPSTRNGDADAGKWWVSDNVVEGSPEVTADNWKGVTRTGAAFKLEKPWAAVAVRQQTAEEAYKSVLDGAGCSLPNRDEVDARIIEEVRKGTASKGKNGFVDDPTSAGGWPALKEGTGPTDSDGDGMPDEWETKHGLDPKNESDGAQDKDKDGYTNTEEFLNGTDPTAFVDYTKPENNVNSLRAGKGSKPADDAPVLPKPERGPKDDRPRVIVTSDGEIDDECSLVRFLLYANEFDIEGIITSSSQYHWRGHKWAGDDWVQPYLKAYAQVHPNLLKHDRNYPTPEFLQARTLLGNVKAEGEMDEVTPGSKRIVEVLLDDSDKRPVWIQAWGGTNTIARALKTIEEEHPKRMAEVAGKIRLFLIWEQDGTYQSYIRPRWGKYGIQTIISDQFIAIFYHWKKYLPADKQAYLVGSWMKSNILEDHGPLCALYKAHNKGEKGFDEGDFRSEGDSPAFLHTIPNGLRSMESPDWGGWGGRYVKVRENTWLDPVSEPGYRYPAGRWYTGSAWGRNRLKRDIPNDAELIAYLKPTWRWLDAVQNDFAARADWCVKPYDQANHPPVVKLAHPRDLQVRAGDQVSLSAEGTTDPDGDALTYRWWQYHEADSAESKVTITDSSARQASFVVPNEPGKQVHIILEVTDKGTPPLVRYQRVVCDIQ